MNIKKYLWPLMVALVAAAVGITAYIDFSGNRPEKFTTATPAETWGNVTNTYGELPPKGRPPEVAIWNPIAPKGDFLDVYYPRMQAASKEAAKHKGRTVLVDVPYLPTAALHAYNAMGKLDFVLTYAKDEKTVVIAFYDYSTKRWYAFASPKPLLQRLASEVTTSCGMYMTKK